MIDKRIRAIYEDGILKPLEPLELAEKQVVELQIRTLSDQPGIAHLEGILAPYREDESPSFEEIEAILHPVVQRKDTDDL